MYNEQANNNEKLTLLLASVFKQLILFFFVSAVIQTILMKGLKRINVFYFEICFSDFQ